MTLQPSVMIWTVLCFAALYWILRTQLFEPLLQVMDARQKKLKDAENARKAAKLNAEKAREYSLAEQEKQRRIASEKEKKQADQIRLQGKRMLEQAKQERVAAVTDYRNQLEKDYTKELESLKEPISQTAVHFLDKLFSTEP